MASGCGLSCWLDTTPTYWGEAVPLQTLSQHSTCHPKLGCALGVSKQTTCPGPPPWDR